MVKLFILQDEKSVEVGRLYKLMDILHATQCTFKNGPNDQLYSMCILSLNLPTILTSFIFL